MNNAAFEPGHFYSPIVDTGDVLARRDAIWTDADPLLGIDLGRDSHEDILRRVFPKYIGEFDYAEVLEETEDLQSYYVDNSQFSWLDARALFVLLREWRPARVIEVGSGFSSLLMADVNRRFLGGAAEITCIEPFPRPFLAKGIAGISSLIEAPVQQVPLAIFERLQAGDVLFIDSSHVSKTGSDVNHLVFEVLPRLALGVHIHFHDIFFPYEYPKDWVLGENRSWNEQYLVRALLMHSSALRITFGCNLAFARHFDALREALARPDGAVFGGGSLWLTKIG